MKIQGIFASLEVDLIEMRDGEKIYYTLALRKHGCVME